MNPPTILPFFLKNIGTGYLAPSKYMSNASTKCRSDTNISIAVISKFKKLLKIGISLIFIIPFVFIYPNNKLIKLTIPPE
ncbi:hypothetical protein TCEA9_15970 [Thermobrachium celere]|nr:hypothetical protein TCEA9_15970 [Thermobrachium celere]